MWIDFFKWNCYNQIEVDIFVCWFIIFLFFGGVFFLRNDLKVMKNCYQLKMNVDMALYDCFILSLFISCPNLSPCPSLNFRPSPVWSELVCYCQNGGIKNCVTVQELLLQLQEEAETG